MRPDNRLSGSYGAEKTQSLARKLALCLEPGDVITLSGEVGAGKTTFARALIQAVSQATEVTSPTFNIMQSYDVQISGSKPRVLWHLDLYRLKNRDEALALGLDELWPHIVLIEWPEIIQDILPKRRLDISLEFGDNPDTRNLVISGDETWLSRLENIK